MRISSTDHSLRPDDFLLSLDAGAVFRGTRTCHCPSGGASRSSIADHHRAGCPELPGKLPDFALVILSWMLLSQAEFRSVSLPEYNTILRC
jgi:hypothetical protein